MVLEFSYQGSVICYIANAGDTVQAQKATGVLCALAGSLGRRKLLTTKLFRSFVAGTRVEVA